MTSNQVDAALASGLDAVGSSLLSLVEDQWFDRKSSRIAPRDLGVPMVAFANAEGGVIVVGLRSGVVEGLDAYPKRINEFRQAAVDYTCPPVRAQFSQISCRDSSGQANTLLVIRVDPSEGVHELPNGDCYLRIGDESRKLNYQQRQELDYDKGQSQYDGVALAAVTLEDLDTDLLRSYVSKTGSSATMKLLQARGLMTHEKLLTNGGYLLFGRHPQDLFPQAYVRVIRYLTNERGTGARLGIDAANDHRVEGSIPQAIELASRLVDQLIPQRRALGPSGTFDAQPIVPRDAWLEGLVNAVIHRSYSLAGDHIRVEIFPNRIEVESPGRFPGLANLAAPLNISRFARNPRIARVCADLRIGQELGEGIRRIFEEMQRVGLTDPVYRQSPGSVHLILTATARLDQKVAARLPRGSQQVLDVLRSSGRPLGTGDVAQTLPFSRPTVAKALRALEQTGLVLWIGKSPRDPRAVWSLVDH